MPKRNERYTLITRYGDVLPLSSWPHLVVQVEGLAMPPVSLRTTRTPTQHGATFLTAVLEPRPFTLTLHLMEDSREGLWAVRELLASRLNPRVGPMVFRLERPDGTVRELRDVVYDAGFELGTVGPGPRHLVGAVRLLALDPVWWGPAASTLVAPGGGTEVAFGFPLNDGADDESDFLPGYGIGFGGGAAYTEVTFNLAYAGNWPAFPTIRYLGPMEHPVLTNVTTGEVLDLDYTLAAGEVVEFDLRFGHKTVTSQDQGNVVGYLSEDSDLVTFHLEPAPAAPGGVNAFQFAAFGTDSATRLSLTWEERYVGL